MKSFWVDTPVNYDGSQLRSLYGYLDHGVQGDSIIGFRGACDIPQDKIVDGEDLRAGESIAGSDMIHFIVEMFDKSLPFAVMTQRLLVNCVREVCRDLSPLENFDLERKGDDLYFEGGKFNISIATVSPASALIHLGVNVSNQGTPVKTSSLEDFEIDPKKFLETLLSAWSAEYASVIQATQKVKWVK